MDFLEHEIEEILNVFREESEEQLQKLNKNLLKLEENPGNYTVISELFREAHSLKGAARMIGLNDIQSIAHKLEDILGKAREEELEITSDIVDIMCKAVDCINLIVDESIKTMGKAQVPEIQETLTALENITKTDSSTDKADRENPDQHDSIDMNKIPPEMITASSNIPTEKHQDIKKLLTQIHVNIEKLNVFSTSTDALEEFLYFVNKLNDFIDILENGRLKGLVDDIRIKVETALRGSGILVQDEVAEIEETFDNFLKLYERVTYNRLFKEKRGQKDISEAKPEIINTEKKTKPEGIEAPGRIEHIKKQEEPLSTEDISDNTEESKFIGENEVNFIKNNINLFSNHTEENILKFEEIILKLNSLTAAINEDQIRQVMEKISDLLDFSREKGIPITQEMVNILEESFNTAINMQGVPENMREDPSLILQRLTVLQQMLKKAVSQGNTDVFTKQENNDSSTSSEKKVNYSPVKMGTELYSKNKRTDDNDKNKQQELKFSENSNIKTLRVDTQKLDHLVNQAGELIIAKIKAKEHLTDIEKMIRYIEEWHREWTKAKQHFRHANKYYKSTDSGFPGLHSSSNKGINNFFEENSSKILNLMNKMNSFYKVVQEDDARLNLIVSGLEEKIKSVRVLPLATIFHLFPRMVRDIARDKGKEVEFFISGSETSVDKKIIEEIKSPLMHIIRNSVDHGIEFPAERIQKGKNPTGKILLAAYHLENSVLIEVTDDGKGIDVEMIKRKVLQKELLTKEELDTMSEEQVMNIIFWPGFSTGETVTDISGRGVGLDIVYTKISQLNGSIKVKSNLGKGCQVSIQIPVTMATVNSFLVEVNSQTFAIPTNSIKTTLLVDPENVFYKEGRKTILVEDKTVPICSLADVLEQTDNTQKSGKLVIIIVQTEDVQVGFVVDKLVGDHEILHKNLSPPLIKVRNVAGITTLGSGDLCLILNVNDLVKSAYLKFGKMSARQAVLGVSTENPCFEKKNILVVDDSATTRILQRNILKASGYEVDVAVNGFDALTKVASNQYDFIVTDAEMPEMNGFELTERLKQDERYKNVPIIIVTSLTSEEDKIKGLDVGADAYITKGEFDQGELLNTIKRLVN